MSEKALKGEATASGEVVILRVEDMAPQIRCVRLVMGDRRLVEVRLEPGADGLIPVVELCDPTLEVRLKVGRLILEAGNASLTLGPEGARLSSTAITTIEGEERLELWGGTDHLLTTSIAASVSGADGETGMSPEGNDERA